MKIKCHRAISAITGKDLGCSDPFLSVGEGYIVLSLVYMPGSGFEACIYSEKQSTVIYVDLKGFEFVCQKTPASWVTIADENNKAEMLPASWNYPSFSEDLSEGEPTAVDLFKKEAKKIYAEEGIEVEESFFTP